MGDPKMGTNAGARPHHTARALPIALLRARETVMTRFRPLLAARGFTEQQWRVLRVLDEQGPLDPTQIAERCVILTPSITRILRNLEDRDLVTRAGHPTDKRRNVVTITGAAKRMILAAAPASNAIYDHIEDIHGAEKIRDLLDLLEDIAGTAPR